MKLDKSSNMPLYLQLKDILISKIRSGELEPGSLMKTEFELCEEYEISRYPVRQALGELVDEGYLSRTRGKGTFVNTVLPVQISAKKNKLLGLVTNHLTGGFNKGILLGFEKQARRRGYLTVACSSESLCDEELICIDRLIDANVSGISIFPCNESLLYTKMTELREKGIYLGLLDRNPGIQDIDYVGSDNYGGAYTAVRHIAMQGFRGIVFVSDESDVSSVKERYDGYLRAVEDFGLNAFKEVGINANISNTNRYSFKLFFEEIRKELVELKENIPLGIFAVNDGVAMECIRVFTEEGLQIGKDIAIVGFDNITEGEFLSVPLTTIAQNGLLIGQTAADIAIDKIEGKTNQVHRSIIPTQLIVRNSCGERG